MLDLTMLTLVVISFALAQAYARLCDEPLSPPDRDASQLCKSTNSLIQSALEGRFDARQRDRTISIPAQPIISRSTGTLPTDGALYVFFLLGVIVIVGRLTYLPALALGPIVEHLLLLSRTLF